MNVLVALFAAASLDPAPPTRLPYPSEAPQAFEGFALAWSTRLPGPSIPTASRAERASPVVIGDLLVVARSGLRGVLLVDRRDGTVVGEVSLPATVAATPTVGDDGRVYVADSSGNLHAFTTDGLRLGKAAWTHAGGSPILSSPVYANGVLYVMNVNEVVYAVDALSGELRWRHAHDLEASRGAALELYGAPAPLVSTQAAVVVAGFSDGVVDTVTLADGELRSSVRVGEGAYPDIIASPALASGHVIAGGFAGPLLARPLGGDAPNWRLDIGSAGTGLLHGETLVHPGTDGKLRAIDTRTGVVLWTWDSGLASTLTVAPAAFGPAHARADVLVSSAEGTLYVVDTHGGEERWRFDPVAVDGQMGFVPSGFSAPATMVGDTMYALGNAGELYAFRALTVAPPREANPWLPPTP